MPRTDERTATASIGAQIAQLESLVSAIKTAHAAGDYLQVTESAGIELVRAALTLGAQASETVLRQRRGTAIAH